MPDAVGAGFQVNCFPGQGVRLPGVEIYILQITGYEALGKWLRLSEHQLPVAGEMKTVPDCASTDRIRQNNTVHADRNASGTRQALCEG